MTAEKIITFHSAEDYNAHWEDLRDFVMYHPGARHRRRLTMQALEGLSFKSCLDVGCGTGEMLGMLTTKYPHVAFTGSDYSDQTMVRNQELFPTCSFIALDIEREHVDATYDLVLCCEVIEHLHEQATAFVHLSKMVAPGGHLVVTCPTGRMFQTEKFFGHVSHPNYTELEQHARANGLRIRTFLNWGFPCYVAVKWATNVRPNSSMKAFAGAKYGWFQKTVCSALYWLNFLNFSNSPRGCQIICVFEKE
jgi:2-polyprenyl-3-methyl-5-hydroxy-6-metoxy-1,4-benzoquinol methylase